MARSGLHRVDRSRKFEARSRTAAREAEVIETQSVVAVRSSVGGKGVRVYVEGRLGKTGGSGAGMMEARR